MKKNEEIKIPKEKIDIVLFRDWENHPVTKAVFEELDKQIQQLIESVIDMDYISSHFLDWEKQYLINVTTIKTLRQFQKMSYTVPKNEEVDDDSSDEE